jgi:hypothetical protein
VPFTQRPEGFSSETLALLDSGMTALWLERVAIAAALCGSLSESERRALVSGKGLPANRRFIEVAKDGAGGSNSAEKQMSSHKFKPGQDVSYHPPKGAKLGASRYKILRQLPTEGGELTYRIKASVEDFERVAKESELTR